MPRSSTVQHITPTLGVVRTRGTVAHHSTNTHAGLFASVRVQVQGPGVEARESGETGMYGPERAAPLSGVHGPEKAAPLSRISGSLDRLRAYKQPDKQPVDLQAQLLLSRAKAESIGISSPEAGISAEGGSNSLIDTPSHASTRFRPTVVPPPSEEGHDQPPPLSTPSSGFDYNLNISDLGGGTLPSYTSRPTRTSGYRQQHPGAPELGDAV